MGWDMYQIKILKQSEGGVACRHLRSVLRFLKWNKAHAKSKTVLSKNQKMPREKNQANALNKNKLISVNA